jgi:hypothetical protein
MKLCCAGAKMPRRKEERNQEQDYFVCDFCNMHFTTKTLLEKHIHYKHLKLNSCHEYLNPCHACHKMIDSLFFWGSRSINDCDKGIYKCYECITNFKTKSEVINHIEKMHSAPKSFKCSLCNKSYIVTGKVNFPHSHHDCRNFKGTTSNNLNKNTVDIQKQNHNINHNIQSNVCNFKCFLCPKKFLFLQGLRSHMLGLCINKYKLQKHNKNVKLYSRYKCDLCSKQYVFLKSLVSHKQGTHVKK